MHGFYERETDEAVDAARELQDRIDDRWPEGTEDRPLVDVSFGPYSAAIQVDGLTVWCSEHHGELSVDDMMAEMETLAAKWFKAIGRDTL